MTTVRRWRRLGCLLLGTSFLSLWLLGHLPLLDVDEPVYGEVGKEMARAGWAGWLSPHYNGALWFDKPPMFYWLTALSMRAFGVTEFAARLPSALLGVGLVAVTYAMARRTFPNVPQVALWAGFVLATTVQFFLLSHAAVTDMTLAFTLTTALLGVYAWITTGRVCWMVLAGAMTGIATLTKGPVAIVLIGLQVIVFLVATRQARRLLSPALWAGFALCLLIALPWYVTMIHLHGSLFIQGFLEANNVTRYLKAEHRETQQFYYYIPVFCGFFLPWTLALPTAISTASNNIHRERREPTAPQPTIFLLTWFVLVFVFFSVSQTKLITYIFPIFPVAAILVGSSIDERVQKGLRDKTAWAFAGLLLILAGAFAFFGHKYQVTPITLSFWGLVLFGSALFSVFSPAPGRWIAPGVAIAFVLLIGWSSPVWKTRAADVSDREAADAAARVTPINEPIYALGMKHTSLVYYSNRRVVYGDDRTVAMRDMAGHPEHVYALGPHVLDDLRDHYGLRAYHILYAKPRLTLIQAAP